MYEPVVLWWQQAVVGGVVRNVRCTMDQLGEGFFELRLLSGDEVLLSEPFEETRKLLSRAEELRAELHP